MDEYITKGEFLTVVTLILQAIIETNPAQKQAYMNDITKMIMGEFEHD